MGKRGIITRDMPFTAGADRPFLGEMPNPLKNVLVHRITVWFPAGNDFAQCYVKRQDKDSDVINKLVDEETGTENGCSFDEPILLTPEIPRLQVYVRTVTTAGNFTLQIDYEEVN